MIEKAWTFLTSQPAPALLIGLGIVAFTIVLIPLALRLAGLTGQQIADTIALTFQFFLNLVRGYKSENESPRK